MTETNPIGSMYGISTNIFHKNRLNVCKYTIHGSYGNVSNIGSIELFYYLPLKLTASWDP